MSRDFPQNLPGISHESPLFIADDVLEIQLRIAIGIKVSAPCHGYPKGDQFGMITTFITYN